MRADKKASQVLLEQPIENDAGAVLDPEIGKEIAGAVGVKLSNPDKIIYLDTEITKAHLVAY